MKNIPVPINTLSSKLRRSDAPVPNAPGNVNIAATARGRAKAGADVTRQRGADQLTAQDVVVAPDTRSRTR